MNDIRKTVRIPGNVARNLGGKSAASAILTAVVRHQGMVQEAMPELPLEEWLRTCKELKDEKLHAEDTRTDIARSLFPNMSYAQSCAVIDVVVRYWDGYHEALMEAEVNGPLSKVRLLDWIEKRLWACGAKIVAPETP